MAYDVRVVTAMARPTVVKVDEVADVAALGETVLRLSREAYAALEAAGVDRRHLGCNVALYGGGVPTTVEVGVELVDLPDSAGLPDLSGLPLGGRVRLSSLPAGSVAATRHRGPYHALPAAHAAVRAWCADHGHELAGANWEIYGDWNDDPAKLETAVVYLLVSR